MQCKVEANLVAQTLAAFVYFGVANSGGASNMACSFLSLSFLYFLLLH